MTFTTQSVIRLATEVEELKRALPGSFEVDIRETKNNSSVVDLDLIQQPMKTAFRLHKMGQPSFRQNVKKMTNGYILE